MTSDRQIAAHLSCSALKRATYAEDTYFEEAHEQFAELGVDLEEFGRSHALLLLKPDAVAARRLLTTIDWVVDRGFRIAAAERVRLTRHSVRALWYFQWNVASAERKRIADLLATASDSLVLLVCREDCHGVPASVLLTEMKGPTNPDARVPGELRHLLGRHTYLLNLVHTADEPADVLRELGIYFDAEQRATVYDQAVTGADRQEHARALARGLYADAPRRSLDFADSAGRLANDVGVGLADSDPAARAELEAVLRLARVDARGGSRMLLQAAWRHGLSVDDWSALVVGSYVLPMRVNGRRVLLECASTSDWRRHRARHDLTPLTTNPISS